MYRRFETTYQSHLEGSSIPRRPLKDGTDMLSRNCDTNCQTTPRNIPEDQWF